jgi:hypothetical protein
MNKLQNYIAGNWVTGEGEGQTLFNAVTGEAIAAASSKGLDFKAMLEYGRKVGNPALRKMTFHQRGEYAQSPGASPSETPGHLLQDQLLYRRNESG